MALAAPLRPRPSTHPFPTSSAQALPAPSAPEPRPSRCARQATYSPVLAVLAKALLGRRRSERKPIEESGHLEDALHVLGSGDQHELGSAVLAKLVGFQD